MTIASLLSSKTATIAEGNSCCRGGQYLVNLVSLQEILAHVGDNKPAIVLMVSRWIFYNTMCYKLQQASNCLNCYVLFYKRT